MIARARVWGEPLTEADLPDLADLARACLQQDGGLPLLAETIMVFQRARVPQLPLPDGLDVRPDDSRVALTLEGEPVAFVTLSRGWIDPVGVVPSWRGRGVGAHLVIRSIAALRKDGAGAVWLAVNIDNPTARALNDRLGFTSKGMRGR